MIMKRAFIPFAVAFVLLLTAAAELAAQTESPRAGRRRAQTRARVLDTAAPIAASGSRRPAIVVLRGDAVVEHLRATSAENENIRVRMFSVEMETYAAGLRRAKQPLITLLQTRGAVVFAETEHVLNAIMVQATEGDLTWLRRQPEVASAEFSAMRRVQLNTATSLVGAPSVWSQLGGAGNAGKGQMIAMLDSGIDNAIAAFSGSGFNAPSGFPRTNASAGATFTNSKVIVAKNYVCPAPTGSCPNSTNTPPTSFDRNASDGYGHGTGTAAAAAGNCTASTLGGTICGVAPGAFVGNYKVFDSLGGGTDAAFLAALNDALADGFTIINYSGGGNGAGIDPTKSTDYTAIHNAVAAGAVVVLSAGNCGPLASSKGCSYYGDNAITDPGMVPDAITVGATSNSHVFANTLTVTAPVAVPANLKSLSAMAATSFLFTTAGPAIVADVTPLDGSGAACRALPAGSLGGKIALIRYSDYCTDGTQTNFAAAAGAVAAIIADNFPESLSRTAGLLLGGRIPSALIGFGDANNLLAFMNQNPGSVSVTFGSSNALAPQAPDLVGDYSSRGPANDFTVKPDLVAPGDVYVPSQNVNRDPSGAIYDVSGYIYRTGTSYAGPIVSGAVAILKQQRPSLSPKDLKSVMANTATAVSNAQDGASDSVMNHGGGRLNLPAALASTLAVDPVAVSFGRIASPAPGTKQTLAVTLKNLGSAAETFSVTVNPNLTTAALQVTADQTTVSLGVGQSAVLNVNLILSTALYGVFEGNIILASQSSPTMVRIPYWAMLGTPALPPGGLVDGASFSRAIAPGGIVSVFGTSLGSDSANAAYLPLPRDLNHTAVTISGTDSIQGNVEQQVPLFYSSSGQVNFQIPYSLITGCPQGGTACYTLRVYLQGIGGNPLTFSVAPSAPGVFASGGNGVLIHALTGNLVTSSDPASVGEIVTIYCSGLGAVTQNPYVYEGDPAPIPPATTFNTPTVLIGGKAAAVGFSGLTPNLAGLYQINVTVAAGTASGSQPLTIAINGGTSASVTTFIK